MFAIYKKELGGFFGSLTGYIVISVFLVVNALFMWVFPGELNIPESGYASLETVFLISPWVFLFLVPAVTMRMISEEKRLGTIELLYSRPITELRIVAGKYLASVTLVLLALLPLAVSYLTVWYSGDPKGNLDVGGTWGSMTGLFFLAAVYAAIGLFASSVTENQVVSFITAVIICFIMFTGFDYLAYLPGLKKADEFITGLGINEHYRSLSRGVIDIGDIAYFVVVVVIFNEATRLVLNSRKWRKS
ncbi:MAG: gliding motility-associated ABC transporter permease subunit GldF [Bacteroidetes bacterium]|nr:gliding motility-associated ABC transporter permease subunit GldF [Bacteroidota bacterium]